jgi:hypothetical protein
VKTIIDFDDLTGRGEPAISLVDPEGDDCVGVLVGGEQKVRRRVECQKMGKPFNDE